MLLQVEVVVVRLEELSVVELGQALVVRLVPFEEVLAMVFAVRAEL